MGRRVLEQLVPTLRRAESLGAGLGGPVRPLLFVEQQVERLAAEAGGFPDLGLGAPGGLKDFVADVHGTTNSKCYLSHGKSKLFGVGKDSVYHLPMTGNATTKPWRQHLLLKGWVERWIEEEGTAHGKLARRAQGAALLGIATGSLKQYCNGWEIPGRIVQAQIVKVFKHYGAKASDLVDNQEGDGPLGLEGSEWQGADEDARSFAALMFHEAKGLTAVQRKAILDLIKSVRILGNPKSI